MVTATDMVVLAGVYPGKRSPCGLYLEKVEGDMPANDVTFEGELVGDGEDEEEVSDAARLGLYVEPYLVQYAADRLGCWYLPGQTLRHPTEPWIGATPDALAVEASFPGIRGSVPSLATRLKQRRLANMESKVVGRHRFGRWGGIDDASWVVPEDVVVQCQWQMTTTGLPLAYVVALLGTSHRVFVLEHSPELEEELVAIGRDFWRHVEERRMPAVDGSDEAWKMVRRALPSVRQPEIVGATPEQEEMMRAVREAQEEAKLWTVEASRRKQDLALTMGPYKGIECEGIRAAYSKNNAFRVGPIKGPVKARDPGAPKTPKKGEAA